LVGGWNDWLAACDNAAAAAAAAGYCESASLRAMTLREIKENIGHCESKERDFEEQKRSKALKNRRKEAK
jgi:hypothetical protein